MVPKRCVPLENRHKHHPCYGHRYHHFCHHTHHHWDCQSPPLLLRGLPPLPLPQPLPHPVPQSTTAIAAATTTAATKTTTTTTASATATTTAIATAATLSIITAITASVCTSTATAIATATTNSIATITHQLGQSPPLLPWPLLPHTCTATRTVTTPPTTALNQPLSVPCSGALHPMDALSFLQVLGQYNPWISWPFAGMRHQSLSQGWTVVFTHIMCLFAVPCLIPPATTAVWAVIHGLISGAIVFPVLMLLSLVWYCCAKRKVGAGHVLAEACADYSDLPGPDAPEVCVDRRSFAEGRSCHIWVGAVAKVDVVWSMSVPFGRKGLPL